MIDLIVLLAIGLVAGALGGLLGIGGGIMLMPVLRFGVGLSPAMAAGTCVLAVFCTTLGGSYRYHRQGLLEVRSLVPVILAGSLTTLACSAVFGYLAARGRWLDLGIGLVFVLVAGRMVLEGVRGMGWGRAKAEPEAMQGAGGIGGTWPQLGAIGAAAGILPGLLGIGTGGILVPAFTFWLRASIRAAMAASLCCFCINAALSSAVKLAQGFVALQIALPLCLGTLIGANLGAVVNKRTHSAWLKLLFGALFAIVAVRFIWSFWR